MKFLFIIVLLGFVFQSAGQKRKVILDSSLERVVSTYASEIENCEVDELDIGSLGAVKEICHGLVNSEVCSEINPEYLVDCDKLMFSRNQVRMQDVGFDVSTCLTGVGHGVEDLFIGGFVFFWWLAALLPNMLGGADWEWVNHIMESAKSSWLVVQAEAERLKEEDAFLPWIQATVIEPIKNQYAEFSCLNGEGQSKITCHVITDVVLAAIASKTVGLPFAAGAVATGAGGLAVGVGALGTGVGIKILKGLVKNVFKRVKKSKTD